VRRTAER